MTRWIDYHSVNGRSPVCIIISMLKMVLIKLSSDNKSWFLRWANDLRKMWYHCWNEVIFIRQWKNDKERKWFLDLGLKGGNALLQSSITHSVTPIIRSSPCHEILVCRWLVGCKWSVLLQMWWKVIILRIHIVSTWSRFHYLMKHDRITDPLING